MVKKEHGRPGRHRRIFKIRRPRKRNSIENVRISPTDMIKRIDKEDIYNRESSRIEIRMNLPCTFSGYLIKYIRESNATFRDGRPFTPNRTCNYFNPASLRV